MCMGAELTEIVPFPTFVLKTTQPKGNIYSNGIIFFWLGVICG